MVEFARKGSNFVEFSPDLAANFNFFKFFWCTPFGLFFYNEPELGVRIDPGMALTPLPSRIGQGSNPRPSDREPSALPLDHSFADLAANCQK
jgi:hypothetical protein